MRIAIGNALMAAVLLGTLAVNRTAAASGEVWLISTRCAISGCSTALEDQPLKIWRLDHERTWVAADLPSLLGADDPNVPTVVFVHGYDAGRNSPLRMAVPMAWPLYRRLCNDAGDQRFRLVIWTWPSQRVIRGLRDRTIRGLRADVQSKVSRTDPQSILMGQMIDRIHPQVPLTLVGYSLGARIVCGALELLGGGQIDGYRLSPRNTAPRLPARAMLVGAAFNADWLLPGHRNGAALSQVDQMLITINHSDPLLRFYPLLYRAHGPQALGRVGPACPSCLGAERAKLELLNVTCAVGKDHHWEGYIARSSVLRKLGSYAFRQPQVSGDAAAEADPAVTTDPQIVSIDEPSIAN